MAARRWVNLFMIRWICQHTSIMKVAKSRFVTGSDTGRHQQKHWNPENRTPGCLLGDKECRSSSTMENIHNKQTVTLFWITFALTPSPPCSCLCQTASPSHGNRFITEGKPLISFLWKEFWSGSLLARSDLWLLGTSRPDQTGGLSAKDYFHASNFWPLTGVAWNIGIVPIFPRPSV